MSKLEHAGASSTTPPGLASAKAHKADFRFLRFRPPHLTQEGGDAVALPHIRLDRAMQFLIGDKLQ